MKRAELCRLTSQKLRERHARKVVTVPKHTFHVSDDSGQSCDFTVSPSKGMAQYTIEDVSLILDALLDVIVEAMTRGESVTVHGYGSFGVRYIKPHPMKVPDTGEWITIPANYAPKFNFGKVFKEAAQLFRETLKDKIDNDAFISEADLERYMREGGDDDWDDDDDDDDGGDA